MIAAGVAFFYMVVDLVNEAESTTPGLQNSQSRKAREYEKYYKTDINGDDILSLIGVSLIKAKSVWRESPLKYNILSYFPDFDMMNQMIENQIQESQFKTFLVHKFKKIEGDYLDGAITLDQARLACESI